MLKEDELLLCRQEACYRRMRLIELKRRDEIIDAGHDWLDGEIAQLTTDIQRMDAYERTEKDRAVNAVLI